MKETFSVRSIFAEDSDRPCSLVSNHSLIEALHRLLPCDFFLEGSVEELSHLLPLFRWVEWGSGNFSLYLVASRRVNTVKFFYEMVSRWLLPGRHLHLTAFFATDFISSIESTLCEAIFTIQSESQCERVRSRLPIFEAELRLGLTSLYHANRLLEAKGLSGDEKMVLIQERILALFKRRAHDLDYSIFSQMQQFLITCGEEFKRGRGYRDLCRIIYLFDAFRRGIKRREEGQRAVFVRLKSAYLSLPFGPKKVLCVFVGLNLLNLNEIFEERHLIRALQRCIPEAEVVPGSHFSSFSKEDATQLLYLELYGDYPLKERRALELRLSEEVQRSVEKWMHPIFMPRNEEEVMRNIITLSNQLKFINDLPQVILCFDEQGDAELSFTIIWLRVFREKDPPLLDLLSKGDTFLKVLPDRVKMVGWIRKKYQKEATVFRAQFSTHPFLRSDHSVDLVKARLALAEELKRLIGEFRDYNGGMLAKQREHFVALKALCGALDDREELLLENFFHAIFPIEKRSVFPAPALKTLFEMFLEVLRTQERLEKRDGIYSYLWIPYEKKEALSSMQLPSSEVLTVSLKVFELSYLGLTFAL